MTASYLQRGKRYADILALAVVSTVVSLLFESFYTSISVFVSENILVWRFGLNDVLVFAFICAGVLTIVQLRGLSFSKQFWMNIRLYPPVWSAAIIGSVLYIMATSLAKTQTAPEQIAILLGDGLWVILMILAAVLLTGAYSYLINFEVRKKQAPVKRGIAHAASESDRLLTWLREERAITSIADDRFGHSSIAKRIAGALLQGRLESIALVGPYGSGKTSILNMVLDYIENRSDSIAVEDQIDANDVILCRIQSWGFNRKSVVLFTLNRLVAELAKQADCIGLSGLPNKYSRIVVAAGGSWSSAIEGIVVNDEEPDDILERLDELLSCIGKRTVLILEDLDRNERDGEFYKEIAALLDRLKALNHVTFVVAIGQLTRDDEILIRVADRHETIGYLSELDLVK
jgi:hypothetical protein